ncbi:DUF4214 domain-containing protein [Halomonas sp. A11-A]|uniref:DUF4214 domain-containing protein n=1 Tax=Halomonas sp. A11-A TaxID=2183985 RepID=UPI000D70D19B|nr:DUF4214 domain-containing protein [Halomonas sp. A11-A]PWV72643.1 uncharacterized protein DUF4214 [Halomonas sp. A11-A]
MATQANLELAQTLYVAYYGRPADAAGQAFWAEQIENNGVAAVVNAFGTSEEFDARFGDLTNQELINNLYQQMFARDAEEEGLNFYLGLLESGEKSLAQIALSIFDGAQNEDAVALQNKVAVAQLFTDLAGDAYAGNDAANAARDFLLTIDADTVVEDVDVQAAVDSLPAAPVDTSGLTEALSNLADANKAKADFLEENEVTEGEVATNLTTAQNALAAHRTNEGSDRVIQARLEDAQDAVAAARAEVDKVPGLTAAVATLENAQSGLEDAQKAQADAAAVQAGAVTTFSGRNSDAVVAVVNYEVTLDGVVVIENDNGTLKVTKEGEAEGVNGIAAILEAVQAKKAADANVESAEQAVATAEAVVAELDLTETAVEAKEALEEAQAALQAHIREHGSDEQLQADLAAAAEGDIDELQQAVVDAQAALDAAEADVEAFFADGNGAEFADAAALTAALDAAAALQVEYADAETALADAITAANGASESTLTDAAEVATELQTLEGAVAEFAVDGTDTVRADYEAALDAYDGLDASTGTALEAAYAALYAELSVVTTELPASDADAADIDSASVAISDAISAELTARETALNDFALLAAAVNTAQSDLEALVTEHSYADAAAVQAEADRLGALEEELTPLQTAVTEAQTALSAAEVALADAVGNEEAAPIHALIVEREGLKTAVESAESTFENEAAANPRLDALEAAKLIEEAAQDVVDTREELISDVAEAQQLVDALAQLNDDIDAAEAALEELGYELPITAEGSVFGTAGDDIFLFSGEDATITGFGATGEDLLYVGTGYSRSDLASDVDLNATRQGSSSELEIFFQQDGNNTLLFIEEVEFAGSATGGFEGDTITLVGVNAEDLVINAEGFITIA